VEAMKPKLVCLIVLSCAEISEQSKEELERTIVALKKTKSWDIEKITLMEDQRSALWNPQISRLSSSLDEEAEFQFEVNKE